MKPTITVRRTGDEGARGVEKADRLTTAIVTVIDKHLAAEQDDRAATAEIAEQRAETAKQALTFKQLRLARKVG